MARVVPHICNAAIHRVYYSRMRQRRCLSLRASQASATDLSFISVFSLRINEAQQMIESERSLMAAEATKVRMIFNRVKAAVEAFVSRKSPLELVREAMQRLESYKP